MLDINNENQYDSVFALTAFLEQLAAVRVDTFNDIVQDYYADEFEDCDTCGHNLENCYCCALCGAEDSDCQCDDDEDEE